MKYRRGIPLYLVLLVHALVGGVAAWVPAGAAMAQAVWYVHPTEGDDDNAGNTPTAPFRTLERMALAFSEGEVQSGDRVALTGVNRGSLFANLEFPTLITNITVGPWGLDANPRNLPLSSPVVRGDLLLSGPFTNVPGVDRFTTPLAESRVVESVTWNWDTAVDRNGRNFGHMTRVDTVGECDRTPFSWSYDGTTLSVNVTPLGNPTVDPASGTVAYIPRGPNGGITLQTAINCRITGITSMLWLNTLEGSYGISMEHASGSVIDNCVTRDTSHHGIGFTGFTGPDNAIRNCTGWGLSGLSVDPNGDMFGYLSQDTELDGAVIENCNAHCYILLTPGLQSLFPNRSVHGLRCGTTSGTNKVIGLDVNSLSTYFYPQAGPYGSPIRVQDAAVPSDPTQFQTYSVRVRGMKVVNGAWIYIGGEGANVAFLASELDLTQCSAKGLYPAGAISTGNWVGPDNNHALFQDCRIRANVLHPNGAFWTGIVVALSAGADLRFQGCKITETGRRVNGSTAAMFYWIDPAGKLTVKDSLVRFESLTGERVLCKGDAAVPVVRRKFQNVTYHNTSRATPLTEWYQGQGQPDIRWRTGWLGNAAGDPLGLFTDDLPPWNGILLDNIDKGRTANPR